MTAEQRAEVRLTEAERAAMDTAVYTHEDATLEQRTAITAAVERILADRAAAEDHGLRDVRRYCEMTLDSISLERRGMAEDILAILRAALDGGA